MCCKILAVDVIDAMRTCRNDASIISRLAAENNHTEAVLSEQQDLIATLVKEAKSHQPSQITPPQLWMEGWWFFMRVSGDEPYPVLYR